GCRRERPRGPTAPTELLPGFPLGRQLRVEERRGHGRSDHRHDHQQSNEQRLRL
ncbi:unnamed protein product, partial [Lampetra planeri]